MPALCQRAPCALQPQLTRLTFSRSAVPFIAHVPLIGASKLAGRRRSCFRCRCRPGEDSGDDSTTFDSSKNKLSVSQSSDADQNAIPQQSSAAKSSNSVSALPELMDGINWYCYVVLGLIFITDFTPLGAVLASSPSAPLYLSLMQWVVFVAPTAYHVFKRGWDVRATFKLAPCTGKDVVLSIVAGPALLFLTNVVIHLKAGGAGDAAAAGDAASRLIATALSNASDPAQAFQLLVSAAVSPAIAEEVMFRGLLLTALLQRLGRVDAVLVCGALFAATHLSVQQFFGFSILGFACGGAAVLSGSIIPAVAVHMSYNAAALASGFLSL